MSTHTPKHPRVDLGGPGAAAAAAAREASAEGRVFLPGDAARAAAKVAPIQKTTSQMVRASDENLTI